MARAKDTHRSERRRKWASDRRPIPWPDYNANLASHSRAGKRKAVFFGPVGSRYDRRASTRIGRKEIRLERMSQSSPLTGDDQMRVLAQLNRLRENRSKYGKSFGSPAKVNVSAGLHRKTQ